MTDRKHLAEWVLERVGDRAEADVRISGGPSSLTRFANSFIHQNVGEDADTVTLRVVSGGRVASGTTTYLDSDALGRFVDETIERCAYSPVDETWPGLAEPADAQAVDHHDDATATASPADRARMVAEFVAAGEGMRAAGYCQTSDTSVVFANSNGVRRDGRYTQATLDGIHQTDTSAGSGHATSVRLGDLDGAAVGALAAQRARDSAATYDIKPGEYEVVLAPECAATIGIFLAFYGFNGKAHLEGQSFVELGEQQFDAAFALVDDVSDPRAMGVGFDTEGTPRLRTELVTDGVSRAVAHDRRTAAKAGTSSTGHAIPGSEIYGPVASAMFITGGGADPETLIADVERGLYVSTFNYCRVLDPKSMAVTGLTRNGTFMIENGQITGAVNGLRFTQSFTEALGQSRMLGLGNDARWADSEFGPGLVHAPTIRLAGWNFTGGSHG
ncbi:MAG TPA: metallopeptidase TldD-related protein [Acidimicrobiia bacterium]|jgi:predicted Zn-dependent protease|nr:metallopeptidase TldD-related protein [Acidimicrobiia bacterium]